jgi:hypothetical protein
MHIMLNNAAFNPSNVGLCHAIDPFK